MDRLQELINEYKLKGKDFDKVSQYSSEIMEELEDNYTDNEIREMFQNIGYDIIEVVVSKDEHKSLTTYSDNHDEFYWDCVDNIESELLK